MTIFGLHAEEARRKSKQKWEEANLGGLAYILTNVQRTTQQRGQPKYEVDVEYLHYEIGKDTIQTLEQLGYTVKELKSSEPIMLKYRISWYDEQHELGRKTK